MSTRINDNIDPVTLVASSLNYVDFHYLKRPLNLMHLNGNSLHYFSINLKCKFSLGSTHCEQTSVRRFRRSVLCSVRSAIKREFGTRCNDVINLNGVIWEGQNTTTPRCFVL